MGPVDRGVLGPLKGAQEHSCKSEQQNRYCAWAGSGSCVLTCGVLQAEGAEEDLFFAREAGSGRLPKYVELLKFKARPAPGRTARSPACHRLSMFGSGACLQSVLREGKLHPQPEAAALHWFCHALLLRAV